MSKTDCEKAVVIDNSGAGVPVRVDTIVKPRGWPHPGQYVCWFEGSWRVVHVNTSRSWINYNGDRLPVECEYI